MDGLGKKTVKNWTKCQRNCRSFDVCFIGDSYSRIRVCTCTLYFVLGALSVSLLLPGFLTYWLLSKKHLPRGSESSTLFHIQLRRREELQVTVWRMTASDWLLLLSLVSEKQEITVYLYVKSQMKWNELAFSHYPNILFHDTLLKFFNTLSIFLNT